ncbi:cob(I)yrinic acid a,c-diamide adenosyltransferase [Hydrogenimonas sp. SS33]|uniref:cob(I)yrinic acid a,c-diamide adenosyltransferase n=1 Tax=Hydrogenimonas leucolamina TaxID=2954236 RepID=UPI00336C2531
MSLRKGQIQLYTGDGKGKTTAAVGQSLRAMGSGLEVLFVQFMKSVPSGEVEMLRRCGGDLVEILRKWDDSFIIGRASERQVALGEALWQETMEALQRRPRDLLVLDEICVAIHFGLVKEEAVAGFLETKPETLEVVLTGRDASPRLVEIAGLVTEMRKIKHYYDAGVEARRGIEY